MSDPISALRHLRDHTAASYSEAVMTRALDAIDAAGRELTNLAVWCDGGNDKLLGGEGGITKDEFAHAIAARVAKIIASRLREILAKHHLSTYPLLGKDK